MKRFAMLAALIGSLTGPLVGCDLVEVPTPERITHRYLVETDDPHNCEGECPAPDDGQQSDEDHNN